MTFELAEPVTAPIATSESPTARQAPPRPLAGIDWTGVTAESVGLAPLIEVAPGEGVWQEWQSRREVAS